MSNLVSPNIYSGAFPLITTNSLKYVLYKESDPGVEVTSQTFAPPHDVRTVTFTGLERTNYRFRLLEMNGASVVSEKANFVFLPNDNTEVTWYEPIEIQADVTLGVVNGTNTFTFDGTDGKFDWRGREIYVERVGQGTMQKNVQYSWDKDDAVFTFLETGDVFQPGELFNVEFGIVITPTSGGVTSTPLFKGILVIDSDTELDAADAGKKIIIEGASAYIQITLPDIDLMQELVPFYFESGIGNHINARIKTKYGQVIKWMKGERSDVKIGVCENIAIYKQNLSPDPSVFRVHSYDGNFMSVGRIVTSDADETDEFNSVLLDGSDLSVNSYCRLYEDFVQKLPPAQVCNYADWSTGDNKYKFSYASGGVFKVPDRRNLFKRNSDGSALPGVYGADKVGPIPAASAEITKGYGYTGGPNNTIFGNGYNNPQSKTITLSINTGNSETTPKYYVSRDYVLI